MPYEKNKVYTKMPFCIGSKQADFYTFYEVKDLAEKCELYKDEWFKFRTIGLLKSINGRFYIGSMQLPINKATEINIRVSMVYMKGHPKSTLIPYTVQLFGTVQWRKEPVIIARILQTLSTGMAMRLLETFKSISTHLAVPEENTIDIGDEDS